MLESLPETVNIGLQLKNRHSRSSAPQNTVEANRLTFGGDDELNFAALETHPTLEKRRSERQAQKQE